MAFAAKPVVTDPVRPKERFLVFGSPAIEDEDVNELVDSMRTGWLGTGPKTHRFEEDFRAYKGANVTIATNSCTAALHLSLVAAGIGPGDEVITSPMTFCATVNTIIHTGATPVLADADPVTMNIDPAAVERAITPRTRAMMPIHLAGRSCDMDALMDIARRHNLVVIEDCAHAIETEYKGRKAGTIGDYGCFSFYVTKNIITGEGGMVTIRNEYDAERVRVLSLHGMDKDAWKRFGTDGYKHYDVVAPGYKYNMMDLQAAIGLQQLKRVEPYWQRRAAVWQRYNEAFADLPITTPAAPEPDTRHAYHLYTILIDEAQAGINRDDFLNAMTAHHIGVGVHYLSVPEFTYYRQQYGWRPEDYPHAMRIGRQTASLPISARLTDEDVNDVITAVRLILNR
jgi:dTDP-4-amino-4,6-dideoxygalactose transaminase